MKPIIQVSVAAPGPMVPQCQLALTSVPTRRRDSRVSAWLLLLLSMACLTAPVATQAATVWTGPKVVFTKADGADPKQAPNQDRLTSNVWLTRGASQGLYNIAREAFFTHSASPADTEWASGTTANYASLTYTDWETWARSVGKPPATPGVNAVLHLKTDDIYLDIKFLSWSERSGGFSYERSTPGATLAASPQAGVWWNPAEGGRGFVIEKRGNTLFLGAFLYDSSGRSTWHAASGAMNGNTFSAALSTYANGQTLTGPYVAPVVTGSAGNISIIFTDSSHGTLTWPGGTIPIQRFDVVTGGAAMTPPAGTPETGIWWNEAEDGRGFALEIQAGTMFLGGYMFDASGNPIWYLSGPTLMTDAMTYVGVWEQLGNGQTMTGTYTPATLVNANVGTVRIQFSDTENATLTLPDGGTINITRFRF